MYVPLLLALMVFSFLFLIAFYITQRNYRNVVEQERQSLLRGASNVESRFLNILYNNITAAHSLAIIHKEFDLGRRFDSIAQEIINKSKYVEAIQITENGVIRHVYPIKGYENTIGINTWNDRSRKSEEETAFRSMDIYFAGPRKLRQGGMGILGKAPTVTKGGVKSLIVVLTKLPTIVKALGFSDGLENRFAYVLRKRVGNDSTSFLLSKYGPAAGREKIATTIPYGDWVLETSYHRFHPDPEYPVALFVYGIFLSLLSAFIVFRGARQPYILKEIIAVKTHEVNERVKELSTIYQLNRLLQQENIEVPTLFTELVKIIPEGWQYPEICVARILYDGNKYSSGDFDEDSERLSADFSGVDGYKGRIEVAYTKKVRTEEEGPFLKEERLLINALAETLEIYFNKLAQEKKLERSEAKFRGAFQHSAIGMALVSLDGKFLSVNHAFCNMLGYNEGELVNYSFQDLTYPGDREIGREFVEDALIGRRDFFTTEKRYLNKNKSVVWVSLNSALVRDSAGRPQYFVSQMENRTARVESEMKFRSLVEKSPVGVYIFKKDHFVYVNPRVTLKTGYSETELYSASLEKLLPAKDLVVVRSKITQLLSGAADEYREEIQIKRKDGEILWIEIFGTVTMYEGELSIIGTMVNVSERKRMMKELVKSEANMKAIFETTEISYMLLDRNLEVLAVNPHFKNGYFQQTGFLLEPGKYFPDLIFDERKAEATAVLYDVLENGKKIDYETVYTNKGKLQYFAVTISPVVSNGQIIGLCHVSQEITERKRMELERENMITDLIERNRDLEQFSYIVSHNIRGPLATILGLANLLDAELSTEENKKVVEGMREHATKLDLVVKDLNAILNVKKNLLQSKVRIDLESLLRQVLADIEKQVKESGAIITHDFSEAGSVESIKAYLHSIFLNLISNGIKFRMPGVVPHLNIRSEKQNDKIILYFRDNGSGIDMEKYGDQVFGLYKRFHMMVEGKGMGLYMVRTQVGALNGTITLQSKPGKGSLFIVSLPL